MESITNAIELKAAILALELDQAKEEALLKAEFQVTYENLKPANLIKNTFAQFAKIPDLKGDMIDTTMSLAAGYISKKAILGSTNNPIKQLLGTALQVGITSLVSKNTDGIKTAFMYLINNFFSKKEKSE
jgi:type I restriction-modification system DNA methylase subunit